MKILTLISILIISVNSCNSANEKDNQHVYYVNSSKISCTGSGPTKCLQVQKSENIQPDAWQLFYSPIEGFTYEEGYIYKILVKEDTLDLTTVPADASSIKYTLVEVLEKKADETFKLNDNWVLKTLNGEEVTHEEFTNGTKNPTLKILIAKKGITGTDSCNSIFGHIKDLDDTHISFEKMGSTKRMCPNPDFTNAYYKALGDTKTYKIEDLHLSFYDTEGIEVLKYLKVD